MWKMFQEDKLKYQLENSARRPYRVRLCSLKATRKASMVHAEAAGCCSFLSDTSEPWLGEISIDMKPEAGLLAEVPSLPGSIYFSARLLGKHREPLILCGS